MAAEPTRKQREILRDMAGGAQLKFSVYSSRYFLVLPNGMIKRAEKRSVNPLHKSEHIRRTQLDSQGACYELTDAGRAAAAAEEANDANSQDKTD